MSPDILGILFYGKKIVIECHCHKIPDWNNNTEGGFHGGRLTVSKGSQFIVVGKERKAQWEPKMMSWSHDSRQESHP